MRTVEPYDVKREFFIFTASQLFLVPIPPGKRQFLPWELPMRGICFSAFFPNTTK